MAAIGGRVQELHLVELRGLSRLHSTASDEEHRASELCGNRSRVPHKVLLARQTMEGNYIY